MIGLIVDLVRQVKGILRPSAGGLGNTRGWGRGTIVPLSNRTGSALPLMTLVRVVTPGGARVEPTDTDAEAVLGVVVGYIDASGLLVEADAPDGSTVAVLKEGVTGVLIDANVSRGDFAFAAATAGQARGGALTGSGAFGQFVGGGAADQYALVRVNLDGDHIDFPGGTTVFLRGDGEFANPGASGAGGGAAGWFGDGSDGAANLDGTNTVAWAVKSGSAGAWIYTMSRVAFLTDLIVAAGVTLVPAGWHIYCSNSLVNDGVISRNGNGAITTAGGAGGLDNSTGGGGQGANGRINTVAAGANGGTTGLVAAPGGAGGAGGSATGAGGTGGVPLMSAQRAAWKTLPWAATAWAPGTTGTGSAQLGGGGGGGAGACNSATTTSSGAGGGGGGVLLIIAKTLTNNGTIRANGGNGANASGTGAAGGGGGGGGGVVILIYGTASFGTEQANGGTHGNGVNGGNNGADGSPGVVVKLAA
jgi:hypothetical protein